MAANSPAQDFTTLMQTLALGTIGAASGWSLHTAFEPPTPNTVITAYDAGGYDADAKWLLDFVIVNVRVRGAQWGYAAAVAKAQEIKDALLGLPPTVVGSTDYIGVWLNGDMIHLGNDQNDRPLISLNFRVARQPSTGTNRSSF
jgi:hypothetical protein